MEGPIRMNNGKWIRLRRARVLLFVLLLLGLGAGVGSWITGHHGYPGVNLMLPAVSASAPEVSFATGFTPVVEKVLPAVVSIYSEKTVRFADSGPTFLFPLDPFSGLFGDDVPRRRGHPREQR